MIRHVPWFLLGVAFLSASAARAQSSPAFDILVDGDLAQDDPASRQFKTLPAAVAAAPAGTRDRPTVIGIRPNVHKLPGPADRGASLRITTDNLTLLGLTDDRRTVVLADDRGHQQGAADNGFVLDVKADGFTLRNLTLLNHCNVDYAYPGDASKNLAKRSAVITQAVALQAAGDRHVYDNVAILSRLDTMFLRTNRSYFRNVRIEGTDDFIGGGQLSVWDDCTIVFPEGRGVCLAQNVVFRRCTFEATNGFQFYKAEFGSGAGRPSALIECVVPTPSPAAPIAWVRGRPATRPSLHSLTYRVRDASGQAVKIPDGTLAADGFDYGVELTDAQARAFNPWNLLRGTDDWDPADARARHVADGDAVYRVTLKGSPTTARSGGDAMTLGATVLPARVADKTIAWSTPSDLVTLTPTADGGVSVAAKNAGDEPQWVPVIATATNGIRATAHVLVEPKLVEPPTFTRAPKLSPPREGVVAVDYALDLGRHADRSVVTWSLCDDAAGANPREVAMQRGDEPLKSLTLPAGAVGKFVRVEVRPKHRLSETGDAVTAISAAPVAAADVASRDVSPLFRDFAIAPREDVVNGLWTVLGKWTVESGDRFENGWGVRPGAVGAALLYANDEPTGDMRVELTMTPEKTDGQGFGGPGGPADEGRQKADVYIKYDPRTRTGYCLRFWRTTQSAQKCMFQLFKVEKGVGSPLNDEQVLSGVFKPTTRMKLEVVGDRLSVTASNDVDDETLSLSATIAPNRFGGAGVSWSGTTPRGNGNVISRLAISYPGK